MSRDHNACSYRIMWYCMTWLGLATGRRYKVVGIVTRLPVGQPRNRWAMYILQTRYVSRHRCVECRPTDRTLNIVVFTRKPYKVKRKNPNTINAHSQPTITRTQQFRYTFQLRGLPISLSRKPTSSPPLLRTYDISLSSSRLPVSQKSGLK